MNPRFPARWFLLLLLGSLLLLGGTGCVSAKYQMAPKETPPPIAMKLATEAPVLAATIETVIVYNGPGSWKKEAYWDEYVLTLANRTDAPLTITGVTVVDALDVAQTPGDDPWKLETASRQVVKRFEHNGRKIALGAGIAAGWALTPFAAYAAGWVGMDAVAFGALGAFVAIPVWAVTKGVRTLSARSAIRAEFDRRRVALPLTLPAGANKTGSFFLPITPGPKRLVVAFTTTGGASSLAIDLSRLAKLHEAPAKPAPTPSANAG